MVHCVALQNGTKGEGRPLFCEEHSLKYSEIYTLQETYLY